MIRLVKLLAATALMTVLTGSAGPPAFAFVGEGEGFNNPGQGYGNVGGFGIEEHREESGTTTGQAGLGFACGHEDKKGETQC